MRVLLVGGGGREHALAWSLANSEECNELYCAPGNAGISAFALCVEINAEDIEGLVNFAIEKQIDLVVVGPEAPLVAGLADRLEEHNIAVFGPSKDAARLEGSKSFMKDLCAKYGIRTASYGQFDNKKDALAFLEKEKAPIVVKADGLAAGKGVLICESIEDASKAVHDMFAGEFGQAGQKVIIEEFLEGEELSYFALADGKTILPLTSAQDHKKAYDGDKGPNTGGMGAYSPAHLMNPALEEKIIHNVIKPTVQAMAEEGCPFKGVLYAGLMIVKGEPYLLEYNVRFGDPECQPLMMRMQGDLLEILKACADGRLEKVKGKVSWSSRTSLCVVMAAKGYPGSYKKGTPIKISNDAKQMENTMIFHAGTAFDENKNLVSTGGRVLGITSHGENIGHAKRLAYETIAKIDWPEGFYRTDIGWRAVQAQQKK